MYVYTTINSCTFLLGCEFFKDYKEKGFNPVNLHFDWSQVHLIVAVMYSSSGTYAVGKICFLCSQ